jgi:hypothetical protein
MYISIILVFLSTFFVLTISSQDLLYVRCMPRLYSSSYPRRVASNECTSAVNSILEDDDPIERVQWPLKYTSGNCSIELRPINRRVTSSHSDRVDWNYLHIAAGRVLSWCFNDRSRRFNGGWAYVDAFLEED